MLIQQLSQVLRQRPLLQLRFWLQFTERRMLKRLPCRLRNQRHALRVSPGLNPWIHHQQHVPRTAVHRHQCCANRLHDVQTPKSSNLLSRSHLLTARHHLNPCTTLLHLPVLYDFVCRLSHRHLYRAWGTRVALYLECPFHRPVNRTLLWQKTLAVERFLRHEQVL